MAITSSAQNASHIRQNLTQLQVQGEKDKEYKYTVEHTNTHPNVYQREGNTYTERQVQGAIKHTYQESQPLVGKLQETLHGVVKCHYVILVT